MKVVWVNVLGIIVNAVACFILIKPFGLSGAFLGMSISQLAMLLWFYVSFYKTTQPVYEY